MRATAPAMPIRSSATRVKSPSGIPACSITTRTPGAASTAGSVATLPAGTATTSRLPANGRGAVTSPARSRRSGSAGLADANTSAGSPAAIRSASTRALA